MQAGIPLRYFPATRNKLTENDKTIENYFIANKNISNKIISLKNLFSFQGSFYKDEQIYAENSGFVHNRKINP